MIYIIYVIYPHDIITYIIEYCIEDSLSLMNFMKTCKIINKKYYLISIIENLSSYKVS